MLADAMNQHSISDAFFEKLYASLYPFRPVKWIPPLLNYVFRIMYPDKRGIFGSLS